MSKQERLGITITRKVDFKKSLTMSVNINAPVDQIEKGALVNLIENAVEIASKWKKADDDSN